ncbi:MAG: HAD-IA family hydrolase [Rhizobiaceae bacterium]|nr:HAD-IA family hydrolase [Rhizobiaceae bacterium]
MSIKPTIVFDLDGTLADTMLDLVPVLNRTIAIQGLKPVTAEQVGHVSGKGIKPMIKLAYTLNKKSISAQMVDELFDIYLKDYTNNIAVNTRFFEGVENCLKIFTDDNWILAVCTNKPVKLADKLLRELGAHQMFSAVPGFDSFDYCKPDARHLIKTIELAGGSASNAIMVGDSQNDILTAQNASIPVVAVDFGYSEHPVATYNPDQIISNFDQLYETAVEMMENI